MKLLLILLFSICLINCNTNRSQMKIDNLGKDEMIALPFNGSMEQCYTLIKKENPAFWSTAESKLFHVIKEDQNAKKSLKFLVKKSKKIWKEFLKESDNLDSWVIKSSWDCCIADAAQAILNACIENPKNHDKVYSKEELHKIKKYISKHFNDAPNLLMMDLIIQKKLMNFPPENE